MVTVSLIPHPSVAAPGIDALRVSVRSPAPGWYLLGYQVEGDIDQLQIPPKAPSRQTDELWKRTCFEAFVGAAGRDDYVELNFSPSTQWAAYGFEAPRRGMRALALPRAPAIVCTVGSGRLDVDVEVHMELPPAWRGLPPRLGLSAVIQDREGRMSWWALAHPAGAPDFHHPDSFIFNG